MKLFKSALTLEKINQFVQGKLSVSSDNIFDNVAELHEANEKSVCFYENEKYLHQAEQSNAGLIILSEGVELNNNAVKLFVPKPYFSFMTLVSIWLSIDSKNRIHQISERCSISKTATIGKNVSIADYVVIEDDVCIGDNSVIEANCVIKENSKIGQGCHLFPNVTIYHDCILGDKVSIHAGSVIGADGFGYLLLNGQQIKIPQVGNVVIENDVEIGANSCIDRATIGSTLIKSGAKIDNLVQIGHNCSVDEHSIICAQVGLAGNSNLGKYVYLGGQVGVGGHLKIDDQTMVGAQSGVASSIKTGKYFGSPVMPLTQQLRVSACMKDLPEIHKYVKKLMRENNERK